MSSSDDTDSDSGAQFKRGKRRQHQETPEPSPRKIKEPQKLQVKQSKSPEKLTKRNRLPDVKNDRRDNSIKHRDEGRSEKTERDTKVSSHRSSDKYSREHHHHQQASHHSSSSGHSRNRSKSNEKSERNNSRKHEQMKSNPIHKDLPKKATKRSRTPDKKTSDYIEKPPRNHHQQNQRNSTPPPNRRDNDVKLKRDHDEYRTQKDNLRPRSREESSPDRRRQNKNQVQRSKTPPKQLLGVSRNSRHSSNEKPIETYGPALPPQVHKSSRQDSFVGPALPPAITERRTRSPEHRNERQPQFGPSIPRELYEKMQVDSDEIPEKNYDIISSDEDDFMIGPLPSAGELSERDLELEKRAIELKLQALDKRAAKVANSDEKHREEWMLELPEIKKVADMGLTSRQFRKNDRPDFSDRTSWTKTPNDSKKQFERKESKEEARDKERRLRMQAQYDEQQEAMAKKHKKDAKRDKSLMEIHEKKLKKEKVNCRLCDFNFFCSSFL